MIRRRNNLSESHEATDSNRWMVSYADFITLLFAFFVVMYALSSMNEGRYRVLAESIATALAKKDMTVKKIQHIRAAEESKRKHAAEEAKKNSQRNDIVIRRMSDSVEKAMTPWIEKGLIQIKKSPVYLQIEINSNALFASGSASVFPQARQILGELAKIFQDFPNAIHVEGFTDNKPINTTLYPSNWELSAARSASIVRMFGEIGINPQRMAALGYGEYQSVAVNDTEEGRSRNRRVVITVLSGTDPRNFLGLTDQSELSTRMQPANAQDSSTGQTGAQVNTPPDMRLDVPLNMQEQSGLQGKDTESAIDAPGV